MAYLVLARKWRPRSFDALVGQEHVVRALTHALSTQRLHHAWLFTGTRGVGKTTLSRILAKSLNCHAGITANPCGECPACTEIDAGRFVDYVELDAASNRGVEEMTQLLEQAVYSPSSGRFKVYMIDEVHMLSGHAFNAMLKTLEEPPPHVKFILATTDPQKIPVTVLSRCLQFNLKQMTADSIISYLEMVLQQENIPYEHQALRLLARAASGSMRDALSLADQGIAYSGGDLTGDAMQGMLGTIDQTHLTQLLDALSHGAAKKVIEVADQLAMRGLSYSAALADLATLLSRIALEQRIPGSTPADDPLRDDIRALAGRLHQDVVHLFYSVAVHSRTELSLAPDEYAGFIMACLRMLALLPEDPADTAPNNGQGGAGEHIAVSASTSTESAQTASQPLVAPESPSTAESLATVESPASQPPVSRPSAPVTAAVSASVPASAPAPTPTPTPAPAPAPAPASGSASRSMSGSASGPASVAPAQTSVSAAAPSHGPDPDADLNQGGTPSAAADHDTEIKGILEAETAPIAAMDGRPKPQVTRDGYAKAEAESGTGTGTGTGTGAGNENEACADTGALSVDPVDAAVVAPDDASPPSYFDEIPDYLDSDEFETLASVPDVGLTAAIADLAPTPSTAATKAPRLKRMTAAQWPILVQQLPLTGVAAELARQSEWLGSEGDCIRLRMGIQTLGETSARARLRTALSEHFGCVVDLDIEYAETGDGTAHAIEQAKREQLQKAAEQAAQNDPFVNILISEFGGQLVSGSVRAVSATHASNA